MTGSTEYGYKKRWKNVILCHNWPLNVQTLAQKILLTLMSGDKHELDFTW